MSEKIALDGFPRDKAALLLPYREDYQNLSDSFSHEIDGLDSFRSWNVDVPTIIDVDEYVLYKGIAEIEKFQKEFAGL